MTPAAPCSSVSRQRRSRGGAPSRWGAIGFVIGALCLTVSLRADMTFTTADGETLRGRLVGYDAQTAALRIAPTIDPQAPADQADDDPPAPAPSELPLRLIDLDDAHRHIESPSPPQADAVESPDPANATQPRLATLTLRSGETLTGAIEAWSDGVIRLALPALDQAIVLSVPEAWATRVTPRTPSAGAPTTGRPDVAPDPPDAGQADAADDQIAVMLPPAEGPELPPDDRPSSALRDVASTPAHRWVAGRVVDVDQDRLRLRFQGRVRAVAWERVANVVLAPRSTQPTYPAAKLDELHLAVTWAPGLTLHAALVNADERNLMLKTMWGQALTLPLDAVTALRTVHGRVLDLTAVQPVEAKQTPYFDLTMPYRVNRGFERETPTMADGQHPRAIAMHSRSRLTWDLPEGMRSAAFHAIVGFELGVGQAGASDLRILADDQTLWESLAARGADPPQAVTVQLHNARRLTLEVDFGPRQDVADRVIWARPRLIAPPHRPACALIASSPPGDRSRNPIDPIVVSPAPPAIIATKHRRLRPLPPP